jgi:glutamine synthetase
MVSEQYQPESGPGQQEFDSIFQGISGGRSANCPSETIKRSHIPTSPRFILPNIFADKAGSGCHLHLSPLARWTNLLPSLSTRATFRVARRFIAAFSPSAALSGTDNPSTNSYRTYQPCLEWCFSLLGHG